MIPSISFTKDADRAYVWASRAEATGFVMFCKAYVEARKGSDDYIARPGRLGWLVRTGSLYIEHPGA